MDDHIRFDTAALVLHLLDQRRLPLEEADFVCRSSEDVVIALQQMVVRGAPAIGVAAAWGCVLAVAEILGEDNAAWRKRLTATLERLAAARPTAVNLRRAVERMSASWKDAGDIPPAALLNLFLRRAQAMQLEDVSICRRLGQHGASLLRDGDTVLTHCNAGALATAGYGTALGVIRAAVEEGKHISVIASETRPFLQGARLTAWELARDNIPVTVACDNACALLMQKGFAKCVIVGADRIAANGDTANKIGTYGIALLAGYFHVPFYVAAPLSTIDAAMPDGGAIPVEERPSEEVAALGGRRIMPVGVPAYNFAFDVTPAALISGIITEAGILVPPYETSIAKILADGGDA